TLLIQKGADIGLTDNEGNSLLMRAATMRQKDLVALLIDKGADVNAKNNGGETALARLANYGSYSSSTNNSGVTEIAKLLLDKGADVNGKMPSGHTVLDVAARYRNNDIVDLLKAKGAKESGLKTPISRSTGYGYGMEF